jgi:hypothetical protein
MSRLKYRLMSVVTVAYPATTLAYVPTSPRALLIEALTNRPTGPAVKQNPPLARANEDLARASGGTIC